MTNEESLYDPDLPEDPSLSSVWLIVATGVGVIVGVLIDLGLWAAWVATKKGRAE